MAQLDKATDYGSVDWGFESLRAHQYQYFRKVFIKNMPKNSYKDIDLMQEALKEAKIAYSRQEVPVGAVVVYQNKIISRAHNQKEELQDPTAHAFTNFWILPCYGQTQGLPLPLAFYFLYAIRSTPAYTILGTQYTIRDMNLFLLLAPEFCLLHDIRFTRYEIRIIYPLYTIYTIHYSLTTN